jgi:hypothetical protein
MIGGDGGDELLAVTRAMHSVFSIYEKIPASMRAA